MVDILGQMWGLLEIPAIWGVILTIAAIGMGFLLKQLIAHMFAVQLAEIKSLKTKELEEKQAREKERGYVRELYIDGIKDYSSKQALALREAYLVFFEESHSTRTEIIGEDFHTKLDKTIQMVMTPLREHLGILDEGTIRKIYDVQHYLDKFKSLDDLKKEKIEFFDKTDMARQFVKADQIAFRLGLISQPLANRSLDSK